MSAEKKITYVFVVWEEAWTPDPSALPLSAAIELESKPFTNSGVFQILHETEEALKVFSVLSTMNRPDGKGRTLEGLRVIPKAAITVRQRLAGYDESPDDSDPFDFHNRLN